METGSAAWPHFTAGNTEHRVVQQAAMKMRDLERTAGRIPVWERGSGSAQQEIEGVLSRAIAGGGAPASAFQNALAAEAGAGGTTPVSEQPFGFGDFIDLINPLHHIPVVGHLYRSLSGDSIRPSSQIIGGALFGGPAGAAGGLVNAIVEYETGKDVTGNALALVLDGDVPRLAQRPLPEAPEQRLTQVASALKQGDSAASYPDLPASLLAFTGPALSAAGRADSPALRESVPVARVRSAYNE